MYSERTTTTAFGAIAMAGSTPVVTQRAPGFGQALRDVLGLHPLDRPPEPSDTTTNSSRWARRLLRQSPCSSLPAPH